MLMLPGRLRLQPPAGEHSWTLDIESCPETVPLPAPRGGLTAAGVSCRSSWGAARAEH